MRTLVARFLRWIACCSLLAAAGWPSVSAQTFQNPPLIVTNTDPSAIVTADVNQDGNPDLIYVDGSAPNQYAIHILLGKGDGTFTHKQDIELPPYACCALTVADVTGDGKLDLIVGGSDGFSGEVAAFPGNGDGTFQSAIVSSIQPANIAAYIDFRGAFAVGDINGDGKPDLAIVDALNQTVDILLGDGAGHFVLGTSTLVGATGVVYLVDLNGDKKLDMVITDPIGAVFFVFLGNGDGTFSPFVSYRVGSPSGAFLLTDIDGDGRPDMLVSYYPGQIGYFKGNSDGTFSSLIPLGASPSTGQLVAAGDLNGDGIPDLTFISDSGLVVSLGHNGLTFGPPLTSISGGSTGPYTTLPDTPVVGDFNSDGHTDLAAAVEGGIELLFGKGDGTFSSASFYDMGQTVGAVAIGNFTANNLPDIAVTLTAPFPRLLLGNGHGAFTLGPDPNSSYGSQSADTNIETADFKGDGNVDLDLGTQDPYAPSIGAQSIAFGNGNGTFAAPIAVPNASPLVADFNNDGRSDMISVNGLTVTVLLGQANGTFNTVTTTLLTPASTIGVGDVNKDGKLDLVVNYSDHIEIWLGNGDGTFAFFDSVPSQGLTYAPIDAVTDVDGDGNPDVLFVVDTSQFPGYGYLTIFYGNGDGTFQQPVTIPMSHQYTQAIVTDLNRDSLPDLVLTDGAGIATMMNLGGRKFDSEHFYIAGRSLSWLSVADLNGDGYPDIAVGNPGGSTVVVLLNQPNGVSTEGAEIAGTLTFSPSSILAGEPFAVTLALAGTTAGSPQPTGSVVFSVDGGILGSAPVANGSATYNASISLTPVQHTVVATYSGDSTFAPKSFATFYNVVAPTYPTETTLSVTPPAILTSQTLRLVATVTSNPQVPQGVVTFFDGTDTLGAASLATGGKAYFDTALLAAGNHSLTATFQGYVQPSTTGTSVSYTVATFTPSTSAPVALSVTSNLTVTGLSTSATSLIEGSVVTFTALVSSGAGVPFGGVTFFDGSTVLGTMALNAQGSVSFSTDSLSPGAHSITATFNANGPFGSSTSGPTSILVGATPAVGISTVVSLAPSINPLTGAMVLTAHVAALENQPWGSVTFLDNGVILGIAYTGGTGSATLSAGKLASGTHNLSASFAGTREFAPSASPEFLDVWPDAGPGFFLSLGASSIHVSTEASEPFQIKIAPTSGFALPVQLSCAAGVPDGYECSFSPPLQEGTGTSILELRPTAKNSKQILVPVLSLALAGTLFVFVLLGDNSARRVRLVGGLLACCAIFGVYGCGPASSGSTSPQINVLTIQASSGAGSGRIVQFAQVSVSLGAR
jgi:hypothetical protein